MDATPIRVTFGILLLSLSLISVSCETLRAPGSTADWFARTSKSHEREINAHREKWQSRSDGKALKWLLATQIGNGMTLDEVNAKLGDIGSREEGTQEFKTKMDGVRIDDVLYRWGPDREGEVFYLVFREGKVVNFDSKRFTTKL
ncbi:MAG: hypothetical protein JWM11_2650 [Planctomycetaceae bacterium]|nr:hypothetical protein [Planctomycetaceae bacterium]